MPKWVRALTYITIDLFRLGAFEACVQFLTGAQLADMEEKKEGESKLEGLANVLQ